MNKNEGTAVLVVFLVIGWTYHVLSICASVLSGKGPFSENLAPARWRLKE
jgi:hypothetical protein